MNRQQAKITAKKTSPGSADPVKLANIEVAAKRRRSKAKIPIHRESIILERSGNPDTSGVNPEITQIAIVSQNAIRPGFFIMSGRNSVEIESKVYYQLCKTNPISTKVK